MNYEELKKEIWKVYVAYKEENDEPMDEDDIQDLVDDFKTKLNENNGISKEDEEYDDSDDDN